MSTIATNDVDLETFLSLALHHGFGRSTRGLRSYLEYSFAGCPIAGRRVLDVGGGTGFVGLYCLARGAESLTVIEPEAAGSRQGSLTTCQSVASQLGASERLHIEGTTLQQFDTSPSSFDLVVLHNSVNHLDESACIDLQRSADARRRYEELFRSLYRLCAPGGDLLITDASRQNFFGLLRLRNPLAPSIEWHKHQTPRTWAQLLESCGFEAITIRWSPFGRLGRAGRMLAANRIAAFFLHSKFILRCSKPTSPVASGPD